MRLTRRRLLVSGATATLVRPTIAKAAPWPERTIQLVHGFGVGGNADIIARLVADNLSRRIGQTVVVEAKPGAGGRVAAAFAVKAPADGYTLAVLPGGHAIAPAMFDGLPYDTVNDFSFISMLTDFPFILVTYPDHPVRTISDLVTAAKSSATPFIYGSAGNGTGQHLSGALFAAMAKINLQHLPFRGGAPGSTEVLGKRIDFLFETPTLLLELIKSGQLRAIAVTGKSRFFALPDIPTIGETVAGYETSSWLGLAAPPNLPSDLVARLNKEIASILDDPAVVERFRSLGNIPAASSPDAFRDRVRSDVAKWTRVASDAGMARVGVGK